MRFSLSGPLFLAYAFFLATVSCGNITSLTGTWSSGSGAVLTGPAFGNPTIGNSFIYPPVAGWSFSFTDNGYFEQSQFTWVSNATDPHCVQAVVIWQHGTYAIHPNGSITTDPGVFAGDGRIQVQDACAATTSVLSYYNQPGLYAGWSIALWRKKNMLQLQAFDGSLMARMYLVSKDPSSYMFPTQSMTNATNTLN